MPGPSDTRWSGGRHAAGGTASSRRGRAVAGILICAGLLGGYYWTVARGHGVGRGDGRAPDQDHGRQEANERFPAETATGPQTLIVLKISYPACGEEEVRTVEAGAVLAGLHRGELLSRFPGYEAEVFRAGQVVLRRVQDGPCPDSVSYRTIGLRDGRVVVFAGRPESPGRLLHDTGILVDNLLPADREKLSRGIVVRGEAEVWRVLEGLGEE